MWAGAILMRSLGASLLLGDASASECVLHPSTGRRAASIATRRKENTIRFLGAVDRRPGRHGHREPPGAPCATGIVRLSERRWRSVVRARLAPASRRRSTK